jgi:hypothetical protein
MIQPHYSTATIDQHMRGQAWHIESFGNERNENGATCRHITTAWTVYIHEQRDHTYEVAQWSGASVYKTHTVQIGHNGMLTCTCPSGQQGFVRSKRGYCNHINRLMVHALRRLPTLPAPAGDVATLPIVGIPVERRGSVPTTTIDMPDARHTPASSALSWTFPRFTEHTVSVMWMPC